MTTHMTLRVETQADYHQVEEVTREAFWNYHEPGCVEHYLIHQLRDSEDFIKELSIVAEIEGKIVGHIAYTKAELLLDKGGKETILCFGPLSVLPRYWRQGIGTALVARSCKQAKALGYGAICIFGDPAYYKKLGFEEAEKYGIATADNMYAAALMVYSLIPGILEGKSGRFVESLAFDVDVEKAKQFDLAFPSKKLEAGLPSQQRFQQVASARKRKIENK